MAIASGLLLDLLNIAGQFFDGLMVAGLPMLDVVIIMLGDVLPTFLDACLTHPNGFLVLA